MFTKLQIAKYLILIGFFLSFSNYSMKWMGFCFGGTDVVLILEDTGENPDPTEKENPEKEEFKEKDKISQFYDDKLLALFDITGKLYPEFNFQHTSVILEYKTPPPEFI